MRIVQFIFLLLSSGTIQAQDYLNVMSFNIRLQLPSDSLNNWPHRKDKVIGQVLFHDAHIVGVQEALPNQMREMEAGLARFKSVGVSRDGGFDKGEFSAIFYDTARLKVLQSATFWLSENPAAAGSKGWDANYPRIVTWARFRDLETGKEFYHFNTHFDHIGKVARRESAGLLLRMVNEVAGKLPVIVTGDFNARPDDEPIQILTKMDDPYRLTDARHLSQQPHYGPEWTFNGFKVSPADGPRIDYIFLRNGVQVLKHAYLSQVWDNRFASDHFAVFGRVVVQ